MKRRPWRNDSQYHSYSQTSRGNHRLLNSPSFATGKPQVPPCSSTQNASSSIITSERVYLPSASTARLTSSSLTSTAPDCWPAGTFIVFSQGGRTEEDNRTKSSKPRLNSIARDSQNGRDRGREDWESGARHIGVSAGRDKIETRTLNADRRGH